MNLKNLRQSPLVSAAEEARRPTRWWLAYLVSIGVRIHTGWNWFMGNVFGVPVSGMARDTTLFRLGPTESAWHWLSGGSFGPEGSFVVTVVWGLALVMSYWYFISAKKP